MANTLRIKRRWSGGAGAPATLKSGELAYNGMDDVLYIGFGDDGSGNATSIKSIAGLGAAVMLTGNQTVAGIKTFTSIPVSVTPGTSDNSTKVATTAFVNNYAPAAVFTPTAAGIANVASFTTPHYGQYIRVGNIVYFSLQITLTPTAVSTLTSFTVIPPIASTFANVFDVLGVGNTNVANTGAFVVRADTATSKIFVSYTPSATGGQGVRVSGSYVVA